MLTAIKKYKNGRNRVDFIKVVTQNPKSRFIQNTVIFGVEIINAKVEFEIDRDKGGFLKCEDCQRRFLTKLGLKIIHIVI